MINYPYMKDPAVRARLTDLASELAEDLPRDRGEALAVLATLLCACADSCDVLEDVIPLVRSVQACYRYPVPQSPAPTPQPDGMRALPRGGRPARPSARRKAS